MACPGSAKKRTPARARLPQIAASSPSPITPLKAMWRSSIRSARAAIASSMARVAASRAGPWKHSTSQRPASWLQARLGFVVVGAVNQGAGSPGRMDAIVCGAACEAAQIVAARRRRGEASGGDEVTMRALDGILVLALEQAVAAPYCSSRLADAGARVIKVERREGDFARGYDRAAKGLSSYFVWLNRGKESLAADIKDPGDAALLRRIVARADVFIQNLLARRGGAGGLRQRRVAPAPPSPDHGRRVGLRRRGPVRGDEVLRHAGPGRDRPCQRHRPPRGSRPRRRLGLRHRRGDVRAPGRARGADPARAERRGSVDQGQPVRRHGRLDDGAAAVPRARRRCAEARRPRPSLGRALRRLRRAPTARRW